MDNDAPSGAGSRRRRRRKKNGRPTTGQRDRRGEGSPFSFIDVQDAHLENEVDSYLDCGPDRARKRRTGGCGGNGGDLSSRPSVDEKRSTSGGVSRAPPMLLHLREIGLSRRRFVDGTGRRASWRSMMLYDSSNDAAPSASSSPSRSGEGGADVRNGRHPNFSETRRRRPVHPPTAMDSRWNGIYSRHSSPACSEKAKGGIRSNAQSHRRSWRRYARQTVPFSRLRTPLSDAVLAVDSGGGHSIAVGVGAGEHPPARGEGHRSRLSINFYGIPSPARLDQTKHGAAPGDAEASRARAVSPLVRTVPLLPSSSVLEHPIRILLSRDGVLGVAFVCHSAAAEDSPTFSEAEDVLGTIFAFECPGAVRGASSTVAGSIRCDNVRLGGWSSFTMRNLLWPCSIVPTETCGLRRVLSAYVLFNDEDDGFRISWITMGRAAPFDESEDAYFAGARPSSESVRPSRTDIVVASDGNVWENSKSPHDAETGCRPDDNCGQETAAGLNVAHEVYLHVDALLSDILSRRQRSLFQESPYRNGSVAFVPEFFYNLASASPDDFQVVLCIAFSNREKMMRSDAKKRAPTALGVFVEVDLLDRSYRERRWVQRAACADAPALRRWCDSLTLNWRMRERRVGVFCASSDARDPWTEQWVGTTHERNVDEDLLDDVNIGLWGDYVEQRRRAAGGRDAAGAALGKEHRRRIAPKDVSMSSLYPHCDIISNRAVQNKTPVERIPSRRSPIELIYG